MSKSSRDVYVSSIKINGRSILPPVLDDKKREEMRQYRELAISVALKIQQRATNREKEALVQPQTVSIDENLIMFEEEYEALSPTLTASTDLNQFLDTTLDASPQPTEAISRTSVGSRLIRSTSYTLDKPSASLLAAVQQEQLIVEPCSALQEERKRSNLPSKKVVAFKRRRKLAPFRSSKRYSQSAKNKKLSEMKKSDDLHLDLDLHLDVPCSFMEPCIHNTASELSCSKHVATQIDLLNPSILSLDNELVQECQNLINLRDINDNTKSDNKSCQFALTTEEICEQIQYDLIDLELDDYTEVQCSSPPTFSALPWSQSTPECSRAATTQTDLSPVSSDDTSHSFSEASNSSKVQENLSSLMTNIQSEYEIKLNALMKQQEMEKLRLKEQFLQQQEHLIQKLSISSISPRTPQTQVSLPSIIHQPYESPRTPLPQVPSPPIHQPKVDSVSPKRALSAELCEKFARLPALVRGFLTRRLMKTDEVQQIKAVIRETLSLALQLHNQPPPLHPSDIALHGRLIQQLGQALVDFHNVFFVLPLPKRMRIISLDRDRLLRGSSSARSSTGSRVSSATQKAQQRRQQQLQRSSTTPSVGPGGDANWRPPPTNRSRISKSRHQMFHSAEEKEMKTTNGDVISEARARRHADRRASLPKSRRPWR